MFGSNAGFSKNSNPAHGTSVKAFFISTWINVDYLVQSFMIFDTKITLNGISKTKSDEIGFQTKNSKNSKQILVIMGTTKERKALNKFERSCDIYQKIVELFIMHSASLNPVECRSTCCILKKKNYQNAEKNRISSQ